MASKRVGKRAAAFVADYLKKAGKEKTWRLTPAPEEKLSVRLPQVAERVLPTELLHALHVRNASTPGKRKIERREANRKAAAAREAVGAATKAAEERQLKGEQGNDQ